MILSGHAPVYLPSILLFTKIAHSDAFMFCPHLQFVNRSWHSRNRIRAVNDTPTYLTVPVQKSMGQPIADTMIADEGWRKKHLGIIKQVYQNRPYFEMYYPMLAFIIETAIDLVGLNMRLMAQIMAWLDLRKHVVDSRQYQITGHKTDMLISMCKAIGAREYLSNEGARDYVDEVSMRREGIKHRWLRFTHPTYDQGAEFIPDLSVIDLLFNCGPDSARIVKGAGYVS
jgi:hypothetical protein